MLASRRYTDKRNFILQTTQKVFSQMIMWIVVIPLLLHLSSVIDCSIYVYSTRENSSVQDYDCVDHQFTPYCRRPLQPVLLQQDDEFHRCYHDGIHHSFRSLRSNKIEIHTVLQYWKSTIDKVDQYAHYVRQPINAKEGDTELCECVNPQSFGKNCEYLLPFGTSLTDVINAKFELSSKKLMYVGEIVCYTTLKCNFGLLCLDWRDVCDGQQQCMSGLDEENCDKLEFNECEDDEYRCMNGMCIPDEYFLDGEYDCMDMSDEKEPFDDSQCPYQSASMECDDRVCLRDQWSCSDGQCIKQRLAVTVSMNDMIHCANRRDQFFWCERVNGEDLWTEPNGRCTENAPIATNRKPNYCHHLLWCASWRSPKKLCSCRNDKDGCMQLYRKNCSTFGLIPYLDDGLLAPYLLQYFSISHNSPFAPLIYVLNGTIKCRGQLTRFTHEVSSNVLWRSAMFTGSLACNHASARVNSSNEEHYRSCHDDSRTFNNRSYHWLDLCQTCSECFSAYRINDGFRNTQGIYDENQEDNVVSKSCANVRRHRFRCSKKQATCLPPIALAPVRSRCDNADALSNSFQMGIATTECNERSRAHCRFLRRYIEASWNSVNATDQNLENWQLKKVSCRSYCDTFQDTISNDDENATLCQSLWICNPEEWQCYTGQCIDYAWVLDGEWDCPDGSDEETIFAIGYSASHPNQKWLTNASLINKYKELHGNYLLTMLCDGAIAYECFQPQRSHPSNCSEPCSANASTTDNPTGCVLEYDREYVFAYCFRTLIGFGQEFECPSTNMSTVQTFTFRRRCSITLNGTNEYDNDEIGQLLIKRQDVTCWNGKVKSRARCNGYDGCTHGEDEFLCGQEDLKDKQVLKVKQASVKAQMKQLRLPQFPANSIDSSDSNRSTSEQMATSTLPPPMISLSSDLLLLLNSCNRGVPIWAHNGSLLCLCPPQYHGDQCQFHSDRIMLLTHVNYTHSDYIQSMKSGIVHKFLVLLLFNHQVISSKEFQLQPATEITTHRKQAIYLHYSRLAHHMQAKRDRYFNRSNIIHEHHFSIHIEAYELKPNLRPRRFAVWRYPIFFDYLPVYRFATILRFLPRSDDDPCRSNPCGRNEECYRVQNQKSQHLCLCKSGFSGLNCTEIDSKCSDKFCSPNATCHSGYQGLTNGEEWAYCICPRGHFGHRCALSSGKCSEGPCLNGGTCLQGSKPNEFECECTEKYYGETCNKAKLPHYLALKRNPNLEYEAVVVQYVQIDFPVLELKVVSQRAYRQLPENLIYYHAGVLLPEVVVAKLHQGDRFDIHLISLRMNEMSIRANASISDHNRCRTAQSLSLDRKCR